MPTWKDAPDEPGTYWVPGYGVWDYDEESLKNEHHAGRVYGPIPPDPQQEQP